MKKECDHGFPSDYRGRPKDCKFCGISWLEFCYEQIKDKKRKKMKKECDHGFPSDYGGNPKDCKFCGISWLEFCYKQRKEGEND